MHVRGYQARDGAGSGVGGEVVYCENTLVSSTMMLNYRHYEPGAVMLKRLAHTDGALGYK